MPFAGQDFSPVGIGSIQLLSFDYSLLLQAGETVTAATWTATIEAGTDPSPQSIIDGAAQISGSIVAQMVDLSNTTNVQNANIYLLTCAAVTTLNQTLLVWAHLPAITPS